LNLVYTLVYYAYAHRRSSVVRQSAIAAFIMLLTLLGLKHIRQNNGWQGAEMEKQATGSIAAALAVGFAAAPFATVATVVKQRSTQSLPFYLILMT